MTLRSKPCSRPLKSIAMNKLFSEMILATNFPAGEGWAGVKKLQP